MMRIALLLLSLAFVCTKGDHHEEGDHHEDEEAHNEVEECEHGWWCFDGTSTGKTDCFNDGEEWCKCTDGSEATYDAVSETCTSKARKECDKYKTNLAAFYAGTCYYEDTCKDKDGVTWKWLNKTVAKCAPVRALCAMTDHAKWDENDKVCKCEDPTAEYHWDHCHAETKKVTNSQKWGYGVIATAIISIFSIFGVLVVVFRNKWWYSHVLSTMVALAMGCLLSDALLHLVPLALGVHNHDHGDDGHGHGTEPSGGAEEEMSDAKRRNITIAMTLGVYIFMLFEKFLHFVSPHDHSGGSQSNGTELKNVESNGHVEKEKVVEQKGLCAVDSVAWMIIFGDGLPNFADGLVMGAAFTNSLATGLGTSIAVFCHEVPHELGDFAVLLNAGMKVKWAILFNFLSACTCFLGLFVGLAIGENDEAQKWIFALTAGMFIYISCADLMPEMERNYNASRHKLVTFSLQQVGFIIGFLIMFLIALYEHDLEAIGGGDTHNH